MPNYKNGKIYTIRCNDTDKYYIGSTTNLLCKRLSQHKCAYLKSKCSSVKILFDLDIDDCYIELLENYPCNSKIELEKREGELIRLHKDNVVNKIITGRKMKEWREYNKLKIIEQCKEYQLNNKEKINEQRKQYREANKEKIKKISTQPYTCDCGKIIQLTEKARHCKSKKHISFFNNI
tara:strand:- start:41 stop:577 length:537 start_codon:yes stop_codon:yes gene_type:complete